MAEPDIAERCVEAINELSGRHAGHRAAHARGTLCAGTFTASPGAAELTSAAHMRGEPVRVTVRFSNGSGDPSAPDNDRQEGRGMAVKFYLDGSTTDIVSLTLPCFFVRTPEDFIAFLSARKPDPGTGEIDMGKVGAFLGEHPETGAALQHILPTLVPPRSYATCVYNSIHAFRLGTGDGGGRFVRYRWVPEAGVEALPEEEIEGASREYLQDDIRERLDGGPVRFTLIARLAAEDDPVDDPTVPWPEGEREEVELGTLELTGLDTTRETGDDVLVFDPTRVTDGIEPSDDRILHVRSPAYSVSVERRSGVPRPA
jgi:catalase